MDNNEKEKDLGDNPSDVNPSQGGNMSAVHRPITKENLEKRPNFRTQGEA